MSEFYFPIFNNSIKPDSTGKAFFGPPTLAGFANATELALILMDDAAECGVYYNFPIKIAGLTASAATLEILWGVNSGTTEEVAFRNDYACVAADEDTDFDPKSSSDESLTGQLSAAHATAKRLRAKSITLIHGNFVDGKLCRGWFGRDNDDANDDIAADVVVFSAYIKITAS
jgi:hypothetical protein